MTIGIHGRKKERLLDQEMHRNTGITPLFFLFAKKLCPYGFYDNVS